MSLFRREARAADGTALRPAEPDPGKALTAAAIEVDLKMPGSWLFFSFGDRRWQLEAWKHYDICGELRFIANWKANAVSRCRMYAAVIDENGVPGDEADDEKVRAVIDSLLGDSPAQRAEALRMIALNLDLVGEVFPIAFGGKDEAEPDQWAVCSTSEVFRNGDRIMVRRPMTTGNAGKPIPLDPESDVMGRFWTPHPRRYDAADSAVRAALPKLRELEQATKQVFASIDSRLASAGLLLLPYSADLPPQPGQAPRQVDLQQLLVRTMSTALQDPSSAAARVPIIVKVPDEAIGKIQVVPFSFEITAQVLEIREKAITGIARSLDTPPEVLMGTGDVSHWSSWAIEESSIKLHVEPLLARIADGMNRTFFQPLLKAMGVADPKRYCVWFDITPLAIRPNRSDQANTLNERGLLSDEATRQANGFEETDKPKKGEEVKKLMRQLVLAQPLYAADPRFQKVLGLPEGIENPTAAGGDQGMLPGAPGAVDPNDPNADPEALLAQLEAATGDATAEDSGSPYGPPQQRTGAPPAGSRTASAFLVAADAAVRRALEVAGGRIVPGPGRDRYPGVPRHELHTRVIPTADRIPALLAGAWDQLPGALELAAPALVAAGASPALAEDLTAYCTALLERGHPHEAALLGDYLAAKRYAV